MNSSIIFIKSFTCLCSHPVDLVAHAAVLDFLHLDVGKALFTAVVALATARLGAVLLAHHSGILGKKDHFKILHRCCTEIIIKSVLTLTLHYK